MTEFPVKSPKKEKRIEQKTVLILDCSGEIALCKRGDTGLLAGLWELPNLPGHMDAEAVMAAVQKLGAGPDRPEWMVERSHIFTHIRWEMRGWRILCTHKAEGLTWATPEELRDKYALPTAFRQFFEV
jgi:A/G-specific adenine glycosylase